MPAYPPVVILVEPLARDRFGGQKARFFPFLLGYLRSRGIACAWFTISHAARKPASDALRVDLVDTARAWLEAQALAQGATHLLANESLEPALAGALAAIVPHLRWFDAPGPLDAGHVGWLHAWLGLPTCPEQFLPEVCDPCYACTPCPYPSAPEPPLVPVVADPLCVYCAPVASNPYYADVPLAGVANQRGCAFCTVPVGMPRESKKPPLEAALEQIVLASRTPAAMRNRSGFQLDSSLATRRLDELVRRMRDQQVAPAALYLTCRPDELLQDQQHIVEGIRCAAEAGHTVHLGSIGAETFSDEENLRLNKGLTAATVIAAIERARAWEAEFPATFFFERAGGMGFILFTPWTTLRDLDINISTASRLALPSQLG